MRVFVTAPGEHCQVMKLTVALRWLAGWPDNGYGTALSTEHGLNRVLWDRIQFISQVNEQTVGRPSIFIPFGGLGSGRMPFGHSGDIVTSWETLQYLPYYSATASNVLYSYIAHDIGGHRDYGPSSLSSFPLPIRWKFPLPIAHTHKALQALLRGLWCAQVTAMTPNSTLARCRCGHRNDVSRVIQQS
jgi:hypothetical protein